MAQNQNFYIGVAFHFFVAGIIVDISNLIYRLELDFKFSVHVDHTKFQPTDDKLSLKEAWSLSRDLFNFWKISDKISKTVRDSLIVSIKFE